MAKEQSFIQYFIPCDGDSEEHPNVFMIRKAPKQLTLADVTGNFPLPGAYLFRAKTAAGRSHGARRRSPPPFSPRFWSIAAGFG